MNTQTKLWGRTLLFVTLVMVFATVLMPLALPALASQQKNKNLWRNLGIGGAAVGAYGLLHHNTALGLLGVAGAAYSAKRYETARHQQSLNNSRRHRYFYHRNTNYYHRNYNNNNYRTNSYYHPSYNTHNYMSNGGSYMRNGRKYYSYGGHQYYENMSTGARHFVH